MKTEGKKHKIEAEVTHKKRKRKVGAEGKGKPNLCQLSHEDYHRVSQQYFPKTETLMATSTTYNPAPNVHSPLLSYKERPGDSFGWGVVARKTVVL